MWGDEGRAKMKAMSSFFSSLSENQLPTDQLFMENILIFAVPRWPSEKSILSAALLTALYSYLTELQNETASEILPMAADDHQLLVVELQVVQIVPAQFGRQELPAEGGLVKALWSDEQRDDAVVKLAVVVHLLRHQAIEPHPKPLFPLLQVGLHPILFLL